MPETRRKVVLPTGPVDGVDVAIKEQTERWTEIALADGSTIRIKPNVLYVTRVDGQWDNEGNPVYAVTGGQIMTVLNVPAHLRKPAPGTKAN